MSKSTSTPSRPCVTPDARDLVIETLSDEAAALRAALARARAKTIAYRLLALAALDELHTIAAIETSSAADDDRQSCEVTS